jgi:hypothetical protein
MGRMLLDCLNRKQQQKFSKWEPEPAGEILSAAKHLC